MTLINYLTRIHFGDDVLEEALWAELERNRKLRPLVIASAESIDSDPGERFFSGFPVRTDLEVFTDISAMPTEEAARKVAALYKSTGRDHLISFGTGAATNLAKVARILIRHDKELSHFAASEGGWRRIAADLPDHYAVPALVGFVSAISPSARVLLQSAEAAEIENEVLIPTVTICDPTLTLGTSPEATASAGVTAIAHCIEAFLSKNYNPPADGIALDGLARAVSNLHKATEADELAARREMMAASLNCALAQQKGFGLAHAMVNALDSVTDKRPDPGAFSRLVLPGVLQFQAEAAGRRYEPLRYILGLEPGGSLADGVEAFLHDLPLPRDLGELGVVSDRIPEAAELAVKDRSVLNAPRVASSNEILSIMHAVQ